MAAAAEGGRRKQRRRRRAGRARRLGDASAAGRQAKGLYGAFSTRGSPVALPTRRDAPCNHGGPVREHASARAGEQGGKHWPGVEALRYIPWELVQPAQVARDALFRVLRPA